MQDGQVTEPTKMPSYQRLYDSNGLHKIKTRKLKWITYAYRRLIDCLAIRYRFTTLMPSGVVRRIAGCRVSDKFFQNREPSTLKRADYDGKRRLINRGLWRRRTEHFEGRLVNAFVSLWETHSESALILTILLDAYKRLGFGLGVFIVVQMDTNAYKPTM